MVKARLKTPGLLGSNPRPSANISQQKSFWYCSQAYAKCHKSIADLDICCDFSVRNPHVVAHKQNRSQDRIPVKNKSDSRLIARGKGLAKSIYDLDSEPNLFGTTIPLLVLTSKKARCRAFQLLMKRPLSKAVFATCICDLDSCPKSLSSVPPFVLTCKIAQLVERVPMENEVDGSNPSSATKNSIDNLDRHFLVASLRSCLQANSSIG